MADLGRQLADLLYGDQAPQTQEPERQKIARLLDADRLKKLEAALSVGSGMAAAVPAGYAALGTLLPTRAGSSGDLRKAAERAGQVQSALTYVPRSEQGMQALQSVGEFLEPLGAPAKKLGDVVQQYTGSPLAAGITETVADPINFIGTGLPTKAAKVAGKAAMATPRVAAEMASDLLMPKGTPRERQRGAIKMKGGNWLAGEVESAVDPLKTRTGGGMDQADALQEMRRVYTPETTNPDILRRQEPIMRSLEQGAAINKWIDKKLGGYIRNEMGTPEDPVRKLADQGIIHSQNVREFDVEYMSPSLKRHRRLAGFPEKGYASTDLGRAWEAATDKSLMFSQAGDYQGSDAPGILSRNPWLQKVSGETPVYETSSWFDTRDLGFDHLIDVLKEDLATGRIRPEQLEKMSMEQAVRRAHQYDQEMAEKAAKATAAAREGLPVYKEYPQGYRWIELNKPGAFSAESDSMGHSVRGYEPPPGHPDWIEGSGDAGSLYYGHGGWEGIKSGQAKVYSLVDSKGAPHVTIEIASAPPTANDFLRQPKEVQDEFNRLFDNWRYSIDYSPSQEDVFAKTESLFRYLNIPTEKEITQIKGKQNRAPKEEYLPFVQDFVRSGNWSQVGDIKNTGLIEIGRSALPWPEGTTAEQINNLVGGMAGSNKPPKYTFDQFIQQAKKDLGGKYVNESQMQDWLAKQIQSSSKAKGGSVRISDNPDTMRLELAGGGFVAAKEAAKAAAKTAAKTAAKAAKEVPPPLPRAAPKTKAEIEAIAERMAPQMLGEYVRKEPGSAVTVAGKTKKQFEREKELPVQLTGEAKTPEAVDIQTLKGKAMMGILGDPSITGRELESVGDIRLGLSSPQHGGPLYGMGREDEAFWASGKGAAKKVQNLADEISKQYGADVLGKYIMMGPEGLNYAQHFADANLQAIDLSKMTKRQIDGFNSLIRRGTPNSGPRPDFPGIEDKQGAYLWMAFDPEIRKHFNSLMQMNTVTEKFNLPSGQDIRFAITEPALRDLERGVTGMSIGEMRPGAELTYSKHPTYEMDIPGKFLGSSKYPVPYELMFPDTVKAIRENPRQAPHEFGSLGMTGPRQIIDQQMIDEIKAYEERIKRLTGKKKGGAVKKQAGGAIKAAAKAVKPTAEQAAKLAASRAEMVLRSRAMQELKDQFDDLPLGQQPQGWMSPERVQQKIDEIRRREASPEGGQIPLLQAGGAVKAAARAAKAATKDASSVLPAAERDANLAKMLKPSVEKGRLYHGTKLHDEYADAEGQAFEQFASRPTWLAKEPYTAAGYSGAEGSTYPVRAQIKNPLRLEFDANDDAKAAFNVARRLGVDTDHIKSMSRPKFAWQVINHPSFVDAVEKAGYDALMIKEGGYDTYGVFDPRRIKSDIGNRGTFDVTKPEMTKKNGGRVKFTDNLDAMRLAVQKRK